MNESSESINENAFNRSFLIAQIRELQLLEAAKGGKNLDTLNPEELSDQALMEYQKCAVFFNKYCGGLFFDSVKLKELFQGKTQLEKDSISAELRDLTNGLKLAGAEIWKTLTNEDSLGNQDQMMFAALKNKLASVRMQISIS